MLSLSGFGNVLTRPYRTGTTWEFNRSRMYLRNSPDCFYRNRACRRWRASRKVGNTHCELIEKGISSNVKHHLRVLLPQGREHRQLFWGCCSKSCSTNLKRCWISACKEHRTPGSEGMAVVHLVRDTVRVICVNRFSSCSDKDDVCCFGSLLLARKHIIVGQKFIGHRQDSGLWAGEVRRVSHRFYFFIHLIVWKISSSGFLRRIVNYEQYVVRLCMLHQRFWMLVQTWER